MKKKSIKDTVNELVNYALAHGVNYFDTTPVYVRGWSEKATGIALSWHPRDSYYVPLKCRIIVWQTLDYLMKNITGARDVP